MTADDSFFDPHQRATIEAAMARIIPTDDQPGAREAGTIDFVDRYLSGIGFIYAKPDGSGFETLDGAPAEAWQQRIEILRRTYVEGIAALRPALPDRVSAPTSSTLTPEQAGRGRCGRWSDAGTQSASAGGPPGESPALQQTTTETELEFLPASGRCTPARASTPTRSMAATRIASAGR